MVHISGFDEESCFTVVNMLKKVLNFFQRKKLNSYHIITAPGPAQVLMRACVGVFGDLRVQQPPK